MPVVTREEASVLLRSAVGAVVPKADICGVGDTETIPEALEMDSVDFLNFVSALSERTGLDIPERDYPGLLTVEGCVSYLVARTSPARPAAGHDSRQACR